MTKGKTDIARTSAIPAPTMFVVLRNIGIKVIGDLFIQPSNNGGDVTD
jgi:hypothetical protein